MKKGIKLDKHGEASEVCVNFIFDKWGVELEDALDVCTEILDDQRPKERFSDTLTRLVSEGNRSAERFMETIDDL